MLPILGMEEFDVVSFLKLETEWIYVLLFQDEVVYVGRTRNLFQRISTHQFGNRRTQPKAFDRALRMQVPIADAAAYEGALIRRFNPRFCKSATSDNSRDDEMLARLGLTHDNEATEAFKARRRDVYIQRHRKSRLNRLARRHWYRGNISAVLWRKTAKWMAREAKAS